MGRTSANSNRAVSCFKELLVTKGELNLRDRENVLFKVKRYVS